MSNSSLGSWSTLEASGEDIGAENGTDLLTPQDGFYYKLSPFHIAHILISISILLISIFGLVGNGTVIWFLGFCMKRNPFTTFILHLAAADLGTLICLFIMSIIYLLSLFPPLPSFDDHLNATWGMFPYLFMYNTGRSIQEIAQKQRLSKMSNGNLGSWSTSGAENRTDLLTPQGGLYHELPTYHIADIFISAFILLISIFGLLGNATVIWFLGFCMKRNPFTTFILHLAVADLGTLICLFTFPIINLLKSFLFLPIYDYYLFISLGIFPFLFMYNTGQYLLTAISMDRCVSVLFPLWHRCERPPHFSTLVCAFIWNISFLLTVNCWIPPNILLIKNSIFYQLLMNAILCIPLMTISTLILLIKVYFISQQRKKGKAVTAILLALLFFLFLAFPYTCISLIHLSRNDQDNSEALLGVLCSCLNSSFNPLIYFLVGRKKHSRSRESLKVIFQRVFKEEEHGREQLELRVSQQI
ncbi:proto-oncogene Mas-like [Lacerta agilis]|uniref:proto-oncogene Mas-like n=1 Tax=Lacerta agilis TaxID=80427 RepID=UPI0014195EFF|nr:proto-oncogene Mas-like [Lacerta agilis]